ncbi:hypothetical protein LEP1GSC150_4988 [Leptospira interrogans serovar Copenhageni str. LT2050]|uniref:Uncharacterized protein n=1 Tax=Leptospira interrogans serovar Copenhageni str. LT2050 TaxID=1001598 RepID=M3H8Z5_LEPIT|nr:hypothetical protein LEP1GSC150_4988 [Leptospira interrogans serovar Copenhageni str. LT2050]
MREVHISSARPGRFISVPNWMGEGTKMKINVNKINRPPIFRTRSNGTAESGTKGCSIFMMK